MKAWAERAPVGSWVTLACGCTARAHSHLKNLVRFVDVHAHRGVACTQVPPHESGSAVEVGKSVDVEYAAPIDSDICNVSDGSTP
jgi:hypothetical protein